MEPKTKRERVSFPAPAQFEAALEVLESYFSSDDMTTSDGNIQKLLDKLFFQKIMKYLVRNKFEFPVGENRTVSIENGTIQITADESYKLIIKEDVKISLFQSEKTITYNPATKQIQTKTGEDKTNPEYVENVTNLDTLMSVSRYRNTAARNFPSRRVIYLEEIKVDQETEKITVIRGTRVQSGLPTEKTDTIISGIHNREIPGEEYIDGIRVSGKDVTVGKMAENKIIGPHMNYNLETESLQIGQRSANEFEGISIGTVKSSSGEPTKIMCKGKFSYTQKSFVGSSLVNNNFYTGNFTIGNSQIATLANGFAVQSVGNDLHISKRGQNNGNILIR